MSRRLLIVALLLVATPLAAQNQAGRQDTREEIERFSRTVRMGAGGRFTLDNVSGSVTVTGGTGTDATIEAVKRTRGDRRDLDEVTIEVTERAGSVTVRTVYPSDRSRRDRDRHVSVDYTVTLPADAAADLRAVSGGITVSNVRGLLTAETTSGSITALKAGNVALIKTVSGKVTLEDGHVDRRGEISVVSGEVRLRSVTAAVLDLKAVSGRIALDTVTADRVDASVVSGSIDLVGPLSPRGRYSLSTHSGPIRVEVPAGTEFDADAATFSGPVHSDFPARTATASGRGRAERSARVTVGGGGAELVLRTMSGPITLTKR